MSHVTRRVLIAATMSITPNPPRWQASADPASIVVPGLDANASVNDQIDQIEQLITIKLQVVLTLCFFPMKRS